MTSIQVDESSYFIVSSYSTVTLRLHYLGYIRDTNGLENLFVKSKSIFKTEDFAHYGKVIKKLKDLVMKWFSISNLYFTAPTFITRLDGNASWIPEG